MFIILKKMTKTKPHGEALKPETYHAAGGERQEGETKMETMRAVTYQGKQRVAVTTVPKPHLLHPKDVVVKLTCFSICSGSDSHLYSGEIPSLEKGTVLGHEGLGIIEQKGTEVSHLQVGDRVVIAFNIACGECVFCLREEYTACENSNPETLTEEMFGDRHSAIFGYSKMFGNVPGSQAEFVRVPFADINCFKLPDDVPDEQGLYMSDVLVTSLHAIDMGELKAGESIVIWGLGPIGLFCARWAQLKGASRVIGIDQVPERLTLASKVFGIEVLDRSGYSTEQVTDTLRGLLPKGADVCVEAVGFRFPITKTHKMERKLGMETDTADILEECFKVVRKFGRVSIIADYVGHANHFPIGAIMAKHLTIRSGQCPCQKYFDETVKALQSGALDATKMVTHHISLEEVPKYYDDLFNKKNGVVKVFVKP
jgi:threonine dehydrogenase-like Zn-dependent dehydrogenase